MKFLIADTETTGLTDPIKIVELGMIEIDDELNVLSEFNSLVNPEQPIESGAAGVHGIRDEHVVDEPLIDDIEFPEGDFVLFAHNAKFDRPLLSPYINIVAQCDTLILARRLLPDSPDHKLATLSAYCGLPETLAHRALGDCRTTLSLIDYMMEGTGWNLTKLINYSNVPVKVRTMPWGKWAGTPMKEVPLGYIKWLKTLDDLDIDMQLTLKDFPY